MRAVFVHLGSRPVPHLWLNLRRHVELFNDVPAAVIVSDKRHLKNIPKSVDTFFYSRSNETMLALNNLRLNPSFRAGFWHFSIERLIALDLVHKDNVKEPLLHIESDVLLLPSFPWDALSREKSLMWGRADAREDIAAILFSPNSEATTKLRDAVLEEMRKESGTSDMRALRAIAQRLGTEEFKYLPYSFSQPAYAGGIFDVLAMGMWLGGMDPSNARGVQTFHISMPHHLVQAGKLKFFQEDEDLLVSSGGDVRKVFSLHIHSKDIKIFGPQWRERLSYWIELSGNTAPIRKFVWRGFISWFVELWREIFSEHGRRAILLRFGLMHRK